MATYAIGDIQGCFAPLQALLQKIQFHAAQDTLWFTGDLVNRGPQSLAVLRWVKSLGEKHITVLGNHDLHLLAIAEGLRQAQKGDTLTDILAAPDREALLEWLSERPLLHHDAALGYVMVHAGLAPMWTLAKAQTLAEEVQDALRGPSRAMFLAQMYGNQPDQWDEHWQGMERLRCITNYLTRMRFCFADGRLDLAYKGNTVDKPSALIPWFDVPCRANAQEKIIFGHWAALAGRAACDRVYPLDTGCVWGNCLTAMRLEDAQLFSVPCEKNA